MSGADVLPNESANPGHFNTARSRPLSADNLDESFPTVVDQYIDHDVSSANSRALMGDKFLIDPGVESRESGGNDAQFTSIVKSQEVLYMRERYCGRMMVEMIQYEKNYNLANHIIRRSNMPSVRKDPKVIEGVCKSKRKSDTIGIWDDRATVANKLWKNYDERDPPVNGMAGQKDEVGREGSDGKGTDGSEMKDVNRLVPWDWKYIRHVAELEKSNKTYIGDSDSLSASTLDVKWPIGPVKRKLGNCPPKAYLARAIDNLLTFRWRTTFFDEIFKPANRICRAIVMERPVPLRYVKRVDHFKQAIREVVLANHLVFSNEWHILHRYISVDNLMVRYYDAKTICGVLIDFNFTVASCEDTEDHTGTRAGTRPFMAWELLESDSPPIHLERFDWESIFFVICWVGCRYSEGKEANKLAVSNWYSPDDATLGSIKRGWLFGPGVIRNFTPFYRSIAVDWVAHMQSMFSDGEKEKERAMTAGWMAIPGDPIPKEFDVVTLGGQVTWDRFWAILLK